jgi:hypothetical protein
MKNDDLRIGTDDLDLDHLDDFDAPRRGVPKQKPRGKNWLAYQIALGIILGGCALWLMGAVASFVAAKVLLGQLQVTFPGFGKP